MPWARLRDAQEAHSAARLVCCEVSEQAQSAREGEVLAGTARLKLVGRRQFERGTS